MSHKPIRFNGFLFTYEGWGEGTFTLEPVSPTPEPVDLVTYNTSDEPFVYRGTVTGVWEAIDGAIYPQAALELCKWLIKKNIEKFSVQVLTTKPVSEMTPEEYGEALAAGLARRRKCDCGKEKHGFMDHVTGCPAGGEK